MALDVNKGQEHDEISIRNYVINLSLNPNPYCSRIALILWTFPDSWKKSNIVPVHKKRGQTDS